VSVDVLRWFYRASSLAFLLAAQFAVLRVATGPDVSKHGLIVLAWVALEVTAMALWSVWTVWGFARAASTAGSLPLTLEPTVQPSKYSINDQRGWAEPDDEESPARPDEPQG
jgi:hypothetical protein